MKLSFNIQYTAPIKPAPKNGFERSFEQAVQARKNLALAATQAVLQSSGVADPSNVSQVKGLVRESLLKAGLADSQVQKVLTFVPFALASSPNQDNL